jgi:hypothetical protein
MARPLPATVFYREVDLAQRNVLQLKLPLIIHEAGRRPALVLGDHQGGPDNIFAVLDGPFQRGPGFRVADLPGAAGGEQKGKAEQREPRKAVSSPVHGISKRQP